MNEHVPESASLPPPALSAPPRPSLHEAVVGRDLGERTLAVALVVMAIVAALGLASLLLAATGSEPGTVFRAMLDGSVGSTSAVVSTLNHAAPILLVALGAAIAARSGLLNIGQEGQVTMGAMAATAVALGLGSAGPLMIPLVLLAAAAGGGALAGLAALLRYGRGVSEVISTLLLNFIAFQAVSLAVNRSWLLQETLPEGVVTSPAPQSDPIPDAAQLPAVVEGFGYRLHLGIVLAVAITLVAAFLMARTRWGFNLRMVGLNARAARRAGVATAAIGGGALVLSGAFAGLAGGVLLSGTAFRLNSGFSNNYGWEGLLVALVAGAKPIMAIPVAVLFGALRAGGGVLASTGVSPTIVGVVQALIVLAVTLPSLYLAVRRQRQKALVNRDRT